MDRSRRWSKIFKVSFITLAALFVVIQLVPYGRKHENPPVIEEPQWDQPRTRALAVRACFDCHSNETRWPWYSHVAPFSWLVQADVEEGRRELNFSEWNRPYKEAGESAETILKGEMPLGTYVLMHPSSRLSDEEKRALAQGLSATPGMEPRGEAGEKD